ncbi:MAG: hypothetical protein ACHRHE_04970 [Tepidisphaerales bacterium]
MALLANPADRTSRPAPPSARARYLLYAAAIGAFAQLAQILLVRELLDSLRGGELLLGVIFAAHLLAGALGVLLAWLPLPWHGLPARGAGSPAHQPQADSANPLEHVETEAMPQGTAAHGLEAHATSRTTYCAAGALTGGFRDMQTTPETASEDTRGTSSATCNYPDPTTIILLPLLTAIALLVTLAFARLAGSTAAAPLHHSLLIAATLAVPAPLLCGLLFGRLLRSNTPAAIPFYQSDTWGAVLAGIVFSFILSTTPTLLAAAIAGMLLVVAAWLSLSNPWTGRRSIATLVAVLPLIVAAIVPLDATLDRLRWRRRLPDHDLREIRLTPHGRLAVLARRGQAQISFFRGPDLLGTLETPPPPDERALADLLACLVPKTENILIIGGSASSLPRQFARHNPRHICLMETDPQLLDLTRQYGSWPAIAATCPDDPCRMLAGSWYDLILIFPGHLDNLLANRLATAEFFAGLSRHLSPSGVIAISLPTFGSGGEYLSPAVAARNRAVAAALAQTFPNVRAIPANGCLLVASRDPITLDPPTLARRLEARPKAAPAIIVSGQQIPVAFKDYFDSLFGGALATQPSVDGPDRQEILARFEAHLASNHDLPNSDTHPRALLASLSIDNEITGHRALDLHELDRPWLAIIPVLFLIAIASAFRLGRTGAGLSIPVSFCALAAGFFAIAFEVAVLHLYQTRYGNLIREIGWLIACFMAGLAIGARRGGRPARRPGLRQRLLLLGMILLCLALAVLPIVFSLLMFLGGLCVGALFALLVQQRPRHASRLYAADLVGSALGALLIGTFWLPIAGLAHCMAGLIALLLLAAMLPCPARND